MDAPASPTAEQPPAPVVEQHQAEPAPVVELDARRPRGTRRKVRPARDPERRRLEADAEAVRRELRRAVRDGDAERLASLRADAAGTDKRSAPALDASPPAAGPVVNVAPAPPASRGPNWPSEAEIAAWRGIVAPLVAVGGAALTGSRWAIDSEPIEFSIGGATVRTSKADALADALASLAAKYLPSDVNSPEAYAAAVAFAVFGGPALGLAFERMQRTRAQVGAAS